MSPGPTPSNKWTEEEREVFEKLKAPEFPRAALAPPQGTKFTVEGDTITISYTLQVPHPVSYLSISGIVTERTCTYDDSGTSTDLLVVPYQFEPAVPPGVLEQVLGPRE